MPSSAVVSIAMPHRIDLDAHRPGGYSAPITLSPSRSHT
ncbi:hypothetical protein Rhow_005284 [Rhodococcus wratislaviensis]|uniref:Uncharacterized protein n=1 Tax=Rhodococcus wratislaviensis TaxID=44752 RepID=A0A402CDF5_RHOWR|nr:hypothetical protein Rhow_005284 [Rhodococcus wratislaviensis]